MVNIQFNLMCCLTPGYRLPPEDLLPPPEDLLPPDDRLMPPPDERPILPDDLEGDEDRKLDPDERTPEDLDGDDR
jgi:hypothetical protein